MSYLSLFDSFQSRDIHVDFAKYGGENYIILADRLTGYLDCQKTGDQITSEAILAIHRWASKFGLPYKVLSDKDSFIEELGKIGVTPRETALQNEESSRSNQY